jgi:hypothetical protein
MVIKLGGLKREEKISLKDFKAFPIWIKPAGLKWEERDKRRPILSADPDITKEVLKEFYSPTIFCTVLEDSKLFAHGHYDKQERNLSLLRFWQGGRWVDLKELKAPRPLTLVAVPKIEGQANVEFYLLTRHDSAAPRIGGRIYRLAGPDKFKILKLSRGMVPTRVKFKPEPKPTAKKATKGAVPMKLAGAKLGPLVDAGKISLKDRIKHSVWVSTYEEELADEDAQRAVISADPNVSSDVIRKFRGATVTFKVNGSETYGIGFYEPDDDKLTHLWLWTGKRWEPMGKLGAKFPLTLEPLCRILGKRDVRFILKKSGNGEAVRFAR